jgi:hypothetical protein
MTDRELLETAAKAARIKLCWRDKIDTGYLDPYIEPHPNPHWVLAEYPHDKWNPLLDDGDALRLAVKLKLCVDCGAHSYPVGETRVLSGRRLISREEHADALGAGADTATRRAIVRAAAEIGKL